jgi:4-cresol dehydrogenase (hydroxylating)
MSDHLAGCVLEPVVGPTLCRSSRRVLGRVRPANADAVVAVVRDCVARGLSLHPVSTGKNWGFGSFLPTRDDTVLLDLSALNAIGPLDREAATVRIEAGVTQAALCDWLRQNAPELALNVTGSGRDTSILGNALERGVGYAGSRAGEIFGLEVVLADGSRHRPAAAWFSSTGAISAGPQMDALFAQANYGVVTAAWLRLRRRQRVEAAVIISGELAPVFELIRSAYGQNLLTLPVHLAGDERAGRMQVGLLRARWGREPSTAETKEIFPAEMAAQTAIAAVHGHPSVVRAVVRELRRLGHGNVRVRGLTANRLAFAERWCRRLGLKRRAEFLGAVGPLLALTWGEPSDAGLAGLDFSDTAGNPDYTATGCIYLNAVTALDLVASCEVEALVRAAWTESALTRTFLSASVMMHIISLHFPEAKRESAHTAARALGETLRQKGFPPYRLGLPTMGTGVPGELAHRLKTELDPRGLLAPGNYLA